MTIKELANTLKEAAKWLEWQGESLQDIHDYSQMFGFKGGSNVFDNLLGDALRFRQMTIQQLHSKTNQIRNVAIAKKKAAPLVGKKGTGRKG